MLEQVDIRKGCYRPITRVETGVDEHPSAFD
jgi:hypothetical protein